MDATAQPFLPLIFLGIALRPVPPTVACGLARPVLRRLARRLAPLVTDRLAGMTGTVAVMPTDLPYGVGFHIADGCFDIGLLETASAAVADARVVAPALVLMDLARGNGRDGDARFFTRDLRMEGDTSLVMALRYALDEAGGPPVPVPVRLQAPLARLARHVVEDTARIQHAIIAPLARWQDRTDTRLADLERRIDQTGRRRRRAATPTSIPWTQELPNDVTAADS